MNRIYLSLLVILFLTQSPTHAQSSKVKKSLIAFWDFSESAGQSRKSANFRQYPSYHLLEGNQPLERVNEGPIGGTSVKITDGNWLSIPRDSLGALNIFGPKAQVTVVAWIKKETAKSWQAIAGVWDETHEKRQYYLFSNAHSKTHQDEMVRYPAKNLIHGHISATGGKSPGQKAWISYASSNDSIPLNQWAMISMTYDGEFIKLYIDGKLSENVKTNPFLYDKGIFDGGADGADFTVGANHVQGKMINQFIGLISGLAVFDRALTNKEMKSIYKKGMKLKSSVLF